MSLLHKPMTMAFYHIAAMNHWREVVAEQLGVLARAGFGGLLQITFSGPEWDERFIRETCRARGLRYELCQQDTGLTSFEFPALRLLQTVCDQGFDGHVLYFHTKAVSTPQMWERMIWRWTMNGWCLARWSELETALAQSECDAAGTLWVSALHPTGAFAGNFWHAKASYIRTLTPLDTYIAEFSAMLATHNPSSYSVRHAAEFWINSRANCRPLNFGPGESRAWDHRWWNSEPDHVAFAHQFGS